MNLARSNPELENRELVSESERTDNVEYPLAERSAQTSGDGAFDVRLEETMFWNGHDRLD